MTARRSEATVKRRPPEAPTPAVRLALFRRGDPTPLDERLVGEGELWVGRDPAADWVVADPSQTLSRLHCAFELVDGALVVWDQSANGTFLAGGERLARDARTPLAAGEGVDLGDFRILVQTPAASARAKAGATAAPVAPAPAEPPKTGQMLDAFCAGAGIDASVFSGEDPLVLMRRVGAVYRTMVLGLGDLMDERTRTKTRLGLEWTTVQAADNNPFRWAPPQQVVVDLLQPSPEGFLGGDAAARSSFDQLRQHHLGLKTASAAALAALADMLAPERLAEPLKGQSFLMRNRTAALWAEYEKAHAEARAALDQVGAGPLARAFREGYDEGVDDAAKRREANGG